jgi:transcriptional regulator with XRE-family HTH domain
VKGRGRGRAKGRGRKRPAGADLIIAQVRAEFEKKREALGATEAARQLGVSQQSFYNYLLGKTLPDLGVLWTASQKWDITWKYMDLSEIMRKRNISTPEQLTFEFLEGVHEDDIEVVSVGREGVSQLRVALKIRFSA